MLDISQVLEVVRNGKNGAFLPNLSKSKPNKCLFSDFDPEKAFVQDSNHSPTKKMIKQLCWLKVHF